MIRFLHAADLHLGLRITRFNEDTRQKIREARFHSLDRLIQVAKQQQAECIILAGDLFDDTNVAHDLVMRTYKILHGCGLPVFVLPGNHDPLLGGFWDRDPWVRENSSVRVLRREVIPLKDGVEIIGCPLFYKRSTEDPTAWIPGCAGERETIRIGVAHGSLRIHENLPEDDHPIPLDVTSQRGLDYLALGHWHRRQIFKDSASQEERIAYSGVHEPMRFGERENEGTGWTAYSRDPSSERFQDGGVGQVLLVRILAPGTLPEIEPVEIEGYRWAKREFEVQSEEDLEQLIAQVAQESNPERTLLSLRVRGTLSAEAMLRQSELESELTRYLYYELDTQGLHATPTEEEIREIIGEGILRAVWNDLRDEITNDDPKIRSRAERALMALYRHAKESRNVP